MLKTCLDIIKIDHVVQLVSKCSARSKKLPKLKYGDTFKTLG